MNPAEIKKATALARTVTHRLSDPPLLRKVSHVETPRHAALEARNSGRCARKTLERPALPTPARDSAAGMTQHGRVRNPARAANNAL